MPIESAQYINTLQPDWPQGVDPEADGDDHIRMVKQVLQNTFPALDAPVTGTPTQINDLTTHLILSPEDTATGLPERLSAINADNTAYIPVQAGSMSAEEMSTQANATLVNWGVVMNILFPIGSVVMNSTGMNPADYMGFGGWTQRTGTIYGVGDAADQNGYNKTITPGAHNADAFWRVQDGHIVAQNLNLAMNPVPDHQHAMQRYGDFEDGKNAEGGGSYAEAPAYSTHYTDPAGGHTPTGMVTIGSGGMADGAQFMQPGWAFTVWERTA